MKNDHAADLTYERYVVEVDGLMAAEYRIFVKALKASLQPTAPSNCVRPTSSQLRN